MPKLDALPANLPPRLIHDCAAAAYVGLSLSTFHALVRVGKMPQPKCLGEKRKAWDVKELNDAVDRLPSRSLPISDTTWGEPSAA